MFVTEVYMRHRYRESCDHVSYRGKYVLREKKAHSYALAASDGDAFLLKDTSVAKAAVCAGQQSVFILFRHVSELEQLEAGVWLLLFCSDWGQVVTAAAQREMSSPRRVFQPLDHSQN